jgi:hypothetical protein
MAGQKYRPIGGPDKTAYGQGKLLDKLWRNKTAGLWPDNTAVIWMGKTSAPAQKVRHLETNDAI